LKDGYDDDNDGYDLIQNVHLLFRAEYFSHGLQFLSQNYLREIEVILNASLLFYETHLFVRSSCYLSLLQ